MTKTIEPTAKELTVVKRQSTVAHKEAIALEIKKDEDLDVAANLLSKITKAKKFVQAEKDKIIKPVLQGVKATRELFRPIETSIDESNTMVRDKIDTFRAAQQKKIDEKQNAIADKVEAGEIGSEEGAEKMEENAGKLRNNVESDKGAKFTSRKVPTYEFTPLEKLDPQDLTKLAHDGLIVWNETAAKAASKGGATVAGLEVGEKEITVAG